MTTVIELDPIFLFVLLTAFKPHPIFFPFGKLDSKSLCTPSFGYGGRFKPQKPLCTHGNPHTSPSLCLTTTTISNQPLSTAVPLSPLLDMLRSHPPQHRKAHGTNNKYFHTLLVCVYSVTLFDIETKF